MKRSRYAESLTGGTGDVNPQFLSYRATQSAADTTTTTTTPIPVQRLPNRSTSQVMEILKVFFFFSAMPASASAAEVLDTQTGVISTSSFGTTTATFSDPKVITVGLIQNRSAFTAAGSYMSVQTPMPLMMDLTDGDGHGILIGTDNLFTQVQSAGTGNTNNLDVKIMYRWKNVSLQEYIGIVQSQQ